MTPTNIPSEKMSGAGARLLCGSLWPRLRCARCRYTREHPGAVEPGDLDVREV
jgi:hypothetical protein